MAPLPPNNTVRYFYDYVQGSTTHTMMVRGTTGSTEATVDQAVEDLLGIIGGLFVSSTITAARIAAQGSNLTFPFASARIGDFFGTGAGNPITDARQITFVGRSPGGRRARVQLFGLANSINDYRVTPAETALIGTAVDALNNFGTDFAAIDGLTATWLPYANQSLNDYWVRQAR